MKKILSKLLECVSDKIENLGLTERQKKFINKVLKINSEEPEKIGFIMRTLVQASMPHSKVNGISYKRKNNNFTLSIIGNEEAGSLPYGTYPRLILSWLASEVVKKWCF